MGSVTAPGQKQLPFDKSKCTHGSGHRCSGLHGCRVEERIAADWNLAMPKVWRELHRRAYTKTVRKFGPGKLKMVLRVFELQKRGVLHVHPVFAYETLSQRTAVDFYFDTLVPLAEAYGFGTEHEEITVSRMEAAAYLSSYFASGSKEKLQLTEAVQSAAMPKSIIHVSAELTMATGVTMRSLRLRRKQWMLDRLPERVFVERYDDETLRPAELRALLNLAGIPPGEVDRLLLTSSY